MREARGWEAAGEDDGSNHIWRDGGEQRAPERVPAVCLRHTADARRRPPERRLKRDDAPWLEALKALKIGSQDRAWLQVRWESARRIARLLVSSADHIIKSAPKTAED